jgi:ATP/maltotriose-dependent transcriptional regulator MalT
MELKIEQLTCKGLRSEQNNDNILETKFLPPVVSTDVVLRHRLFGKLSEALNKKLSLITACSGSGKSNFLSSYLKNNPVSYVWYNLDNRLSTDEFLINLITAINQKILYSDNRKKKTVVLLNKGWKSALTTVINQILAKSPEKILIILDDFHKVPDDSGMLELINYFVTNSPSNLHLIIVSRFSVRIPLTKLRAEGNIAIFNSTDFAFNFQELETFSQKGFQLYLPKKFLEVFLNYTGGWTTGIRMLTEAIIGKDVDDIDAFVSLLKDSAHVLFQYFNEEVFVNLSEDLQVFLLESSIFEHFCIPLCETVRLKSMDSNIGELINIITEMELFITASSGLVSCQSGIGIKPATIVLPRKILWYSYNEIFKTFLRQRLSAEYSIEIIQGLHKKAALWFRDNDYWQEALRHFALANDYNGVKQIIETSLPVIINTNRGAAISTDLSLIPEQIIGESASLLIAQGFSYFMSGENDLAIISLLNARDKAVSENNNYLLLISLDYLLQAYQGMELYAEMRDSALYGISKMKEDYIGFVIMSIYLANSYIYLNCPKEAKNIWLSIKSSSLFEVKNSLFQKRLSLDCINILIAFGEFEDALSYGSNALKTYNKNKDSRYGLALASMAKVKHEMGFFEESSTLFESAVSELKNFDVRYAVDSVLNLEAINSSFLGNIDKFRRCSAMAVKAHCQGERLKKGFLRAGYHDILSVFKCFHERNDEAFFDEADQLIKVIEDNNKYYEIYETFCWLAPMYAFLGEVERAVELLLKVIETCSIYNAPYGEARARLIVSYLYLNSGRFNDSIMHMEKTLIICERYNYVFLFLNKERAIALKILPFCLSNKICLRYTTELLIKMGRECADGVVNCLKESEREVKKAGIEILIKLRYRDAESDLINLLQDSDKEICRSAKIGLNKFNLLPPEPLKIHTFGKFKAYVGDRIIVEGLWKRKTAKSFFKYFVFHSSVIITLEKLEEIFFNDKTFENAKLNIRQAISSLRKVLEPGMS